MVDTDVTALTGPPVRATLRRPNISGQYVFVTSQIVTTVAVMTSIVVGTRANTLAKTPRAGQKLTARDVDFSSKLDGSRSEAL
jgi:hypothetical protein